MEICLPGTPYKSNPSLSSNQINSRSLRYSTLILSSVPWKDRLQSAPWNVFEGVVGCSVTGRSGKPTASCSRRSTYHTRHSFRANSNSFSSEQPHILCRYAHILISKFKPCRRIVLGGCRRSGKHLKSWDRRPGFTLIYKECGRCSHLFSSSIDRPSNLVPVYAGYPLTQCPAWVVTSAAASPARHGRSTALASWAPSFVCEYHVQRGN